MPKLILVACRDTWAYIARYLNNMTIISYTHGQTNHHPGTVKKIALERLGYSPIKNECPCCQYVFNLTECITPSTCKIHCPLIEFWIRDSDPEMGKSVPCERKGSAYSDWMRAETRKDRAAAALRIVRACDNKLADLSNLED